MNTTDCYGFIKIGLCIRLLMNVNEKSSAKFVRDYLDVLKDALTNVSFDVSIAGSTIFTEIMKKLGELNDDTVIGKKLCDKITSEMLSYEKIVFAESLTKRIFLLPQRRYNSDYLLSSPQNLFKKGLFAKLTELAIYDINSACRCILFGEGTAAAFHILRATEDVLKQYYYRHKKEKRLAKPMWGPMTEELRNKKTNKPPDVILDSLDLVRKSYRNPTQHPDATYDIESAQDLFGVCIDLINKMGSEPA